MKLSYFDLLSPSPIYLTNVGSLSKPTLREIGDVIGYDIYQSYLSTLRLTPDKYYASGDEADWYNSLNPEEKKKITLYHLATTDKELFNYFMMVFSFFFIDKIMFDNDRKLFLLSDGTKNEKGDLVFTGIIDKNNFNEICNAILKTNGIETTVENDDLSQVKSPRLKKIMEKLKAGRSKLNQTKKLDSRMELANIISAIATSHNSLNIVNIWDATVYQVYDALNRQINKFAFDIQSTSVSVWGDKKKSFDIKSWLSNINKET